MVRIALAFSLVTLASNAWAQELVSAEHQEKASVLEDIIVQARRRSESLLETPIALSAFNKETLENRYVADLTDLTSQAPNVVLSSIGAFPQIAIFSIRGISFNDIEGSFDPAIGVTVNNVFLGRNAGSLLNLYDVEQVEILRGPQGTLFGRNTIGGSINVRTVKAEGEWEFTGQLTGGSQGRFNARATAQAPLIQDKLAVRLAFLSQNAHGFQRNTRDNSFAQSQDILSGRASLRFTPTPDWDINLVGDYTRDRPGSLGFVPAHALPGQLSVSPGARFFSGFPSPGPALPGSVIALSGLLAGLTPDQINRFPNHPYDNAYNGEPASVIRSGGLTLDASYTFKDSIVRSITSWRRTSEYIYSDFDGTALPLLEGYRPQTHSQFSQELNINTDFGNSDWTLTGGLYFFTQRYDIEQYFLALPQNPFTSALEPFDSRPFGGLLNNQTGQRSDSYAAYLETSYQVTPELAVTLGGRLTYDTKSFRTSLSAFGNAPGTYGIATCATDPSFPTGGPATRTLCRAQDNWTEFTPRAILRYQPTEAITTYASYSRGYKAGGFNGRAGTVSSLGPFTPEFVDAFEVGFKSQWLDRRLRANLTWFWNNYKDQQVEVVAPQPLALSGQETVVRNAAQARTWGLELELSATPLRGASVGATIGYLNAAYKDFSSPIIIPLSGVPTQIGIEDLTVFKLRRAPKWSFGLFGAYEYTWADVVKSSIRLDWRHTSEQFSTVRNQSYGRVRPLGILDGSLAISDPSDRYSVSVYGKNLTNEVYVQYANSVADGPLSYEGLLGGFSTFAPKREIGAEVKVKF